MSGLLPRIDFYTAHDGRRLAARVWNAVDPPRARVVFLHGVASHGGWYNRSCHFLNSVGYEVHFLDRRGSGLNVEGRGDVDRYETWISDVTTYIELIGKSRPVVLCGISWGGKLAAAIARQQPGLVGALALLCPGLYSYFEPGLVQRAALRGPATPRMRASKIDIPLWPETLFTETPPWCEFVANDPLSLREITLGFARADLRMTRLARTGAPYIRTPTLLMLAGRDKIVCNQRCREYLGRTSAVHKTLIEYPSACHTIEFEPDPQRYFVDLAEWIGTTISV